MTHLMIYDWPSFLLSCSSLQRQCPFLPTLWHTGSVPEARDLLLSRGRSSPTSSGARLLLGIQVAVNNLDPNPSQPRPSHPLQLPIFCPLYKQVSEGDQHSRLLLCPRAHHWFPLACPMSPIESLARAWNTVFWAVCLNQEVLRNPGRLTNLWMFLSALFNFLDLK